MHFLIAVSSAAHHSPLAVLCQIGEYRPFTRKVDTFLTKPGSFRSDLLKPNLTYFR